MTLKEWLKGYPDCEIFLHGTVLVQGDWTGTESGWNDDAEPGSPWWMVRVLKDGTAVTYCVDW